MYHWGEEQLLNHDSEAITDIEELVELLRESGNSEESVDSCYIHNTYTTKTSDGKFMFVVTGSSYRKDQCVCDQEMDQDVTVTDLVLLQVEKEVKEAEASDRESKTWVSFFEGKTFEDLKSELLKYKFPKLK